MVYDFSLASMYEMSGVDTAMCLRTRLLSEEGYDVKSIFVTMPTSRDIELYLDLGLRYDQIMVIPFYFTGLHSIEPKLKPSDVLRGIKPALEYTETINDDRRILIKNENKLVATINLTEDTKSVYSVDYFKDNYLVRTDFYSDSLYCSNIYRPKSNGETLFADLRERIFYTENGSTAFLETKYKNQSYYIFPDGSRYNSVQLFNLFVEKLGLTKQDVVIIDRPRGLFSAKALFEKSKDTNIVAVLHSEHFYPKGYSVIGDYLSIEYGYWFKSSKFIHTMIVSTEEQKKCLEHTLREYGCEVPDIKVIPAFCITEQKKPTGKRRRKSVICVSRLHDSKKIEWTIWAAIKAHKLDNEIKLDLYGTGRQEYLEKLETIIREQKASDYITLKGFMNVEDVYKDYELYISTSLTESFGITLLEAAASGLPIIGFDVRYGNRLFIESNKNGYLIPYNPEHLREKCPFETEIMALRMVELLSDTDRLDMFSKRSYEISERFLSNHIKKKWCDLIEEQTRTIERN